MRLRDDVDWLAYALIALLAVGTLVAGYVWVRIMVAP